MEVTPSCSVHHREAGHDGGEPQEGLQAGERRAQHSRLHSTRVSTVTLGWLMALPANDAVANSLCPRVESRVIGVNSGAERRNSGEPPCYSDPMGKRREPDIFDDNPLTEDFLEWMVSPDG